MEKEEQHSLVEILTKRGEAERVLAVAEAIFKHERQARCFALMLSGVAFKIDDESITDDLLAASQEASTAATAWREQREALMAHLKATASVLPESSACH